MGWDSIDPDLYLVGLPAYLHPGSDRYIGFRKYLRTEYVKPPMKVRFFTSLWGWRLDNLVTKLSPRPYYTLALFLMECRAAIHMLFHRDTLYHAVKGDVDLSFLPKVSRLTGNVLVASYHEPTRDLVFWKIDKRMTRNLAGVILLGECQRSHFRDIMPPERIFVLPHGVDTEYFVPGGTPPAHPTCVTVGSHLRDSPTLSAAMKRVWEVNPAVRLIVVGARRPHDPNPPVDLVDDRVEYLDHIDDAELLRTYWRSSMAVLSLKNAVANNALLEAMSCGLPVIASNVGGIPEYLGTDTGILFPKKDVAALADAILRVAADPELARAMGAASRQRALRFDYSVIAQEHSAVYAKVMEMENRRFSIARQSSSTQILAQ
jgi:glycosyltransferase involved in cell wall biosynthesis